MTYDAPPATDLAQKVARAVGGSVRQDPDRGLDHGAYVPLVELFPEADVPVLQLSLPTLDPRKLYALGERLAELRDEGTLIVTSGFTTHNLRWFNPAAGPNGVAPTASSEFDHWAAEALANKDIEAILDFERTAPAAHEAHPRTEHWAPLYVALGAAAGTNHDNESVIDGSVRLSKRSSSSDRSTSHLYRNVAPYMTSHPSTGATSYGVRRRMGCDVGAGDRVRPGRSGARSQLCRGDVAS